MTWILKNTSLACSQSKILSLFIPIRYDITVQNIDNPTSLKNPEYERLINKTETKYPLAVQYLDKYSIQHHLDPFPRSTQLIQEKETGKYALYMVDRGFNFLKYIVTPYGLDNEIYLQYKYQLNISIVNVSCQDLMPITKQSNG